MLLFKVDPDESRESLIVFNDQNAQCSSPPRNSMRYGSYEMRYGSYELGCRLNFILDRFAIDEKWLSHFPCEYLR